MSIDASRWAWKQAGLRPSERLVLLSLADRAGENHDCFPSISRLEKDTGLNRKTIYQALKSLEEKGVISIKKRHGAANKYRLIGVIGRHEPVPKTGHPENGTSTKNGTPTSTENGTGLVPKTGPEPISNLSDEPDKGETPAGLSPCPYRMIVDLYHEKLPMCPRVVEITDGRKKAMRARWQNGSNGLEWWEGYFDHVAQSRFLTGKVDPPPGRKQFVADIDFLIRESTIVKTREGKYHG